jgi:hypothetical protein
LLVSSLSSQLNAWSWIIENIYLLSLTVSGTLLGITNTFGTIPGIIVPILVGDITNANVCIQKVILYKNLYMLCCPSFCNY